MEENKSLETAKEVVGKSIDRFDFFYITLIDKLDCQTSLKEVL